MPDKLFTQFSKTASSIFIKLWYTDWVTVVKYWPARVSKVQAVSGFKYLYLRKSTFYLRVKVPKRLGAREVRLCLRTKKLSVAVVILNLLSPFVSRLKQLVIRSRTLDTSLICLQFTQIKDAMLKQLTVADIDPMIAKLEQGYSDGGHSINALGQ